MVVDVFVVLLNGVVLLNVVVLLGRAVCPSLPAHPFQGEEDPGEKFLFKKMIAYSRALDGKELAKAAKYIGTIIFGGVTVEKKGKADRPPVLKKKSTDGSMKKQLSAVVVGANLQKFPLTGKTLKGYQLLADEKKLSISVGSHVKGPPLRFNSPQVLFVPTPQVL